MEKTSCVSLVSVKRTKSTIVSETSLLVRTIIKLTVILCVCSSDDDNRIVLTPRPQLHKCQTTYTNASYIDVRPVN